MVNKRLIAARMVEIGKTQIEVANEIGMSPSSLSQKLNAQRPMTLDEAERIQACLSIGDNEFCRFFFS